MDGLLHPRHWPSWILVGVLRALGRLPFPLLWLLGQGLGRLGYLLAGSRRRIAERNLELCLRSCSCTERRRWLRQHFGWLGVAALSQGLGWGASRKRLARLVRIHHRDRVVGYLDAGKPVIFLLPHFVGLELGGAAFTALFHPGVYMYQRIRNPVLEWQVRQARTRFGAIAIERHEPLRVLIGMMRRGTPFFYLPDQDAGRRGLFVPFCGVPASTVPMLGRFVALTDAVVIPTIARFRPWGRGLDLIFDPPLEAFPTGDPVRDTTRMNQVIEARVRTLPEQYFWVHRRFKTRPPGDPPLYPSGGRR